MRLRNAGWIVLVVAACGTSQQPLCTPPTHTTYSCDPVPAGSPGCTGGPKWTPGGAADAGIRQDDVDLTFPDGCEASIPDCSPFYRGDPRGFQCSNGAWAELL